MKKCEPTFALEIEDFFFTPLSDKISVNKGRESGGRLLVSRVAHVARVGVTFNMKMDMALIE